MDFLSRWLQKLSEQNFLIPPFPQCRVCLLYADDTLVILKPTSTEMQKVKLLFRIFGQLSGLQINLSKSELALTSSPLTLTQQLASVLQCKPQSFPIKYLGLPLSDRAITKAQFLPVIDKIQTLLAGWKSSLLSIGGRLILVNAVLSAVPLFLMSAFLLPKGVIRKIDQIRRKFLWHGHKSQTAQQKGLYMVNWSLVTRPRKLGGLGVRDISIANQALLMKWQWQWHQQQHNWWKEATPMTNQSDRPWDSTQPTYFWKSMKTFTPAFECSISFQVGNGEKTKFWHDNWYGGPLKTKFPNLYHQINNKQTTVAQCAQQEGWTTQHAPLTSIAQMEKIRLLQHLQQFQITQTEDVVIWLRANTTFSVSSAYKFLSETPGPLSCMQNIWSIKAPLRVSVFAWLLLNNRLTTVDNLVKRGWNLPNMCAMCRQNEENAAHLMQDCLLARETRAYIAATFSGQFSLPPRYTAHTSSTMIIDEKENLTARKWEITTCFVFWRERCRRIFSNKEEQLLTLVREIRSDYKAWFQQEN